MPRTLDARYSRCPEARAQQHVKVRVSYHASLYVGSPRPGEVSEPGPQLSLPGCSQVIQRVQVEILCQVAWNCVKGVQKPAGNEGKWVGAENEHFVWHIRAEGFLSRSRTGKKSVLGRVMRVGNIQPAQATSTLHTTRCLEGRSDF